MSPAEVILSIDNLRRDFGGVAAVQGICASVRRGSIASMIGPNGAGKTTVFNAITGVIPATSGKIRFSGSRGDHDITWTPPDEVCRLGIARTFQNIRLFSDLTALENVKIGFHRRIHGRVAGALMPLIGTIIEERAVSVAAMRCLEFVGLGGHAFEAAGALCYGDQRRLEIARALGSSPELLLLDEPAAGMNAGETQGLIALVRRIRAAGVSVFLIEHDMKVVMSISDHIHVLDHGIKIAEGTPEEVRCHPRVIEAYLGTGVALGANGCPGS